MPRNSSRAQLRQGHVCGLCSLCCQEKFTYSHAADLGREEKDRLIQHGKNIRDSACICKTCVNDIRRNLTKCDYIPRWVKVTFAKLKCTVPKCTSKSRVVQCLLATKDHIHDLLKIPNTPSNSDVDQVYLCLEHYKIIHRSLPENRDQYDHSRHQCTLCRKVIPSVRDHRHCPNPQIINEHLKNHTDFDGDLDSTAIICRTCFICHQIILKSRENDSLDSELLILVDKLKQDMMGITISGLDSIVEYSLLSSAIALGDNLLNQWPMFLPEVYKSFCGTFNEMSNHHNLSINVSPENVVSSRYLLSYLVTKLDKHLVYTMKQRSAGILLYRKGADLLLILTKILHRQRPCSCNQATTNVCTISSDKGCDDRHGSASVLAWEEMNKTLHEQIDKNKGSMQGEMFNISSFDVDHWIDIIDKNILKMLAVMTKTKRDKNMHCNEVYEDMMKSHSKKLRCFNIACILLFCTNSECNFPMHILLTDIIESFGGSTELVSDFTSFFVGLGKVAFFKAFYTYSEFISGESGIFSRLLNEASYLAFLRIIVILYFQKHRSCFSNYNSPIAHFNSHKSTCNTIKQQHLNWIDSLRKGIWDHITFEDQLIPSNEALYGHFLRSSWVIDYWRKAMQNNMSLLPVTSFGWKDKEGTLSIQWDSEQNIQKVKERVIFLLRGCKCIKSNVLHGFVRAKRPENHVVQGVHALAAIIQQLHKVTLLV